MYCFQNCILRNYLKKEKKKNIFMVLSIIQAVYLTMIHRPHLKYIIT